MYNEVAATCTNTAGSYKCDCVRPFWDGDGTVSMLSTAHGAGISCAAVYGIPPSAPPSAPPPPAAPPVPPSPPLPEEKINKIPYQINVFRLRKTQ